MFYVAIESVKNAEKKGGCAKAYLARLTGGAAGVAREFAKKQAALNKNNRRAFRMDAAPGDVFEARRWWWDGERYQGGVVWFGVQADGSIHPLSRDEAFASITTTGRIESAAEAAELPAIQRPTRIAPNGVFCLPKKPARDHAINAATAAATSIIDA